MTEPSSSLISSPSPEPPMTSFTLADFIRAFLRRWYVFIAIIFLFLLGGVVYHITLPSSPFPFQTSIQIGFTGGDNLLEPPEVTKLKLENSFIPQVFQEHAAQNQYTTQRYSIKVEIHEDGPLITLKSLGYEESEKDLLAIHQKVADLLIANHTQLIELTKRDLQKEKLEAELDLEDTKKEIEVFPERYETLDKKEKLIQQQIDSLKQIIALAEEDRSMALRNIKRGGLDSSVILIINEIISNNYNKLQNLETLLSVGIQNDRASLRKGELELKRKQTEQEQKIADIEFKINNFQGTKIILPPSRLLRGSDPSSIKGIIIFGLIGVIIGLFATAATEFMADILKEQPSRKL